MYFAYATQQNCHGPGSVPEGFEFLLVVVCFVVISGAVVLLLML